MKKNSISMHSTVAGSGNLASMVEAARLAGFDAVEPVYSALYDYLDAGYSVSDLRRLLDGLELPGVGWIDDIERQGEPFEAYLDKCERLFSLCGQVGVKGVQMLTGPLDYRAVEAYRAGKPFDGYMGLQDKTPEEQVKLTAKNCARLADAAAPYGLTLYMEPLCWTPLGNLQYGCRIIEQTGRDNLKLCMDFWHFFVAGDTPDDVAALPKEYIYGVHICDSLKPDGGVPNESILRAVPLGEGVIPVREWVDAVKSTGFDGWWGCESFDHRQNQMSLNASAVKNYKELSAFVR